MRGPDVAARGLASGALLLASMLASSCVAVVRARVDAFEPGRLRLRNESDETVCYVTIAPSGRRALDRLRPDEVVLPGEERDFEVEAPFDEARQVRVLDCAERELFAGDVVVDARHGVRVVLFVTE